MLCRLNERIHTAGTFCTVRAFAEQPIVPPDHKRPYRIFAGVIIRRKVRAFQIPNQLVSLSKAIVSKYFML